MCIRDRLEAVRQHRLLWDREEGNPDYTVREALKAHKGKHELTMNGLKDMLGVNCLGA